MHPWYRIPLRPALLLVTVAFVACGGKETPAPAATASAQPGSDLTPFQLEHGIGPVTAPVVLGPVDKKMAHEGEELFTAKCSACHKMGERYVGPPLGDIAARRSAAFIMNQILNPEGMYSKHPEVKKLLAEYMTQMPNLALTQEQARQVVEYLRTQAPGTAGK
jgi:mono/diheme cytochrome c family protein